MTHVNTANGRSVQHVTDHEALSPEIELMIGYLYDTLSAADKEHAEHLIKTSDDVAMILLDHERIMINNSLTSVIEHKQQYLKELHEFDAKLLGWMRETSTKY